MKLLVASLIAVGLAAATYNRGMLPENVREFAWTQAAQRLPESW
jgi:hypothetical protein